MLRCISVFLILFSFGSTNVFKQKTKIITERVLEKENKQKLDWKNQIIGSKSLLNDFPQFWSYDVDNYEENEFNLLLNKISRANEIEEISVLDYDSSRYSGNDNFIPYYINFNILDENDSSYKLLREFYFNEKISVLIFKKVIHNLESTLDTRLDILVYDHSNNKVIDGLNICLIGNGDQHAYSRNFYIEKGIIYVRDFYVYDSESSSSPILKYKILPSGHLVRYFTVKDGSYQMNNEEGIIENNIKVGLWIEKKPNRFVGDNTYLEAIYKEGKPIDKWNYYNLINDNEKGSKLLMTEEYSNNSDLIKREIID